MSPNNRVKPAQISAMILPWYDRFARTLPWRLPPSNQKRVDFPDPYKIWLSEVMLQQTQVITVIRYFENFLSRWPTVHDLANAKDADVMAQWAGLGYYARARNLLKTARIVSKEYSGAFPATETGLLGLPGIGAYTAAAIAAIAFEQKTTVLDGNIERVIARLFLVTSPLPASKPQLHALAAQATPDQRLGDYVQALMDLGATICTPRKPICPSCPLQSACQGHAAGIAQALPAKQPKKAKPTRNGIVYFVYTDAGQVLLETRPSKGLLGGMQALPTSEWVVGKPMPAPPVVARWQALPDQVRHVFTHFNLELSVKIAKIANPDPTQSGFVDFPDPQILPSVMRKAYILGLKNISNTSKSGNKAKGIPCSTP